MQSPLTAIFEMLRNCVPSTQVLKARMRRDGYASKLLNILQQIFCFSGTSGEVHACTVVLYVMYSPTLINYSSTIA